MSMIQAALALLATGAPLNEAMTHEVVVNHRGADVTAHYRASTRINTRQRGIAPPNRQSTQRCDWTAELVVERMLGSDAPARIVATDRSLTGTRPGACATQRAAIEGEIAGRQDAVRERLVQVAEADRRDLMAELAALDSVAARD
jgi:hypothetical protein